MCNDGEGLSGVYLAYFSADFGTTMGIYLVKEGIIAGGDLGGGIYDGIYEVAGGVAIGRIRFRSRTPGTSITGASSDVPMNYETPIELTLPLDAVDFHQLDGPAGRVNVRFEKLRGF